jgi:hypothetical protein
VSAFVLPTRTPTATTSASTSTSTTSTSTSTELHSSRSQTQSQSQTMYDPVATSGPSWNGQQWEGQAPSFEQEFDRNRNRNRNRNMQQRDEGRPYFPQPNQQPGAPMVRYSTLTEPEKESLDNGPGPGSGLGRGASTRSSYYDRSRFSPDIASMSTDPHSPAIELPVNSRDIQGGSRGTWSSDGSSNHDQVQVTVTSDGRPISCDVECYQGPDNTPQRMRIFSEDGRRRPFTTTIQTPQGAAKTSSLFYNPYNLRDSSSSMAATSMATGGSHSISIINRGPMEFPIAAGVQGKGTVSQEERAASMADYSGRSMQSWMGRNQEIHGGVLKTYPFDPSVASVNVKVLSQGLPIMCVVELWQGPGDVKTVAQIYCDDGRAKPFEAIIETPGTGNTIAIRNVGPTAYPIEAILEVYSVDDSAYSYSYPTIDNNGGGGGGTENDSIPFFGRY